MGLYAESAQLCAMVQDDNLLCIQALRQAMEPQNPEVPVQSRMYLTGQNVHSGESSMEGSMTMETTPPQVFTGVSPSSLKVFATHNTSRPMANMFSGNLLVADLKATAKRQGHLHLLFNDNWLH
jgi:hypothetical protein